MPSGDALFHVYIDYRSNTTWWKVKKGSLICRYIERHTKDCDPCLNVSKLAVRSLCLRAYV